MAWTSPVRGNFSLFVSLSLSVWQVHTPYSKNLPPKNKKTIRLREGEREREREMERRAPSTSSVHTVDVGIQECRGDETHTHSET